jgi:hypothetical protein
MNKTLAIVFRILFLISVALLIVFGPSSAAAMVYIMSIMTVSLIGGMVYDARMRMDGQDIPRWFRFGYVGLNLLALLTIIILHFVFHIL